MEAFASFRDAVAAMSAHFPGLSLIAAITVAAILYYGYQYMNRAPQLNYPVVGEPGTHITKKELVEGARKVRCLPQKFCTIDQLADRNSVP